MPFDLDLGNGMTLHADCLVKSFGGPNGMIIVRNYDAVKEHLERIRELGFGFAVQDEPRGKDGDLYNRAAMIEMLNDWRWSGLMANAPSWIGSLERQTASCGSPEGFSLQQRFSRL